MHRAGLKEAWVDIRELEYKAREIAVGGGFALTALAAQKRLAQLYATGDQRIPRNLSKAVVWANVYCRSLAQEDPCQSFDVLRKKNFPELFPLMKTLDNPSRKKSSCPLNAS